MPKEIHIDNLETYEELNSLTLEQLKDIYFNEICALEPLENAQAYRDYISSYCVSDGTPLH